MAATVLVAMVAAGCGSQHARATAGSTAQTPQSLAAVFACLRAAGADPSDISGNRDLEVSRGELSISFASFDAYVGVALDRREAVTAAREIDRQITVLQQAGRGVVRDNAVFYFDAPVVPHAGTQLVEACLSPSPTQAATAMAALAASLPRLQYPAVLERRLVARCRALTGGVGCACIYGRAARLFSYAQIDGLGRVWVPQRARSVFAGLLGICESARVAPRGL